MAVLEAVLVPCKIGNTRRYGFDQLASQCVEFELCTCGKGNETIFKLKRALKGVRIQCKYVLLRFLKRYEVFQQLFSISSTQKKKSQER